MTSEHLEKFIIERQSAQKGNTVLSNDVVSAMIAPYIGLLFVSYSLLRVAEAIENAKTKTD